MNRQLKLYPAYKDSGEQWLGKLPEHWEIHPNRALFYEVRDRDHADEQMLSVTITKGVVTQKHLLEDSSKKDSSNLDRSAYKFVQPDDIAYNKMRAWQGAIGLSSFRGIISPAYVVERPRTCCFPRYYHHLFRTPEFVKEAERWSYGITSDMWSLRPEHFRLIYSCLPPLDEQSAIVRYLDYMDRRIQRYIRAKQKLIKLLEEQKQAIIHQAVTGQIDVRTGKPYPKYKPSGMEWLGDVPEHWEITRLKRVSRVQTGITLGKNYGDLPLVERPYLRVANVQASRIDLSTIKTIRIPVEEADGATLVPGDVLMTEGGDIDKLGRGCVWHGEIPGCLHQNHVFAVRPFHEQLMPEFLVALMGSLPGRRYFQLTAKQTTNLAATNSTTLGDFPFPLPGIHDQRRVIDWISEHSLQLEAANEKASNEIALLGEYRTRLISDVVTGKLDVREAATNLPEELEEELPEDQEQEVEENEDLENEDQPEDEE